MRLILAVIFVFGFLIWDISLNDGYYSRHINGYLYDFAREVRWR